MTALQAAVAGVSGGATGYAQYQRQQKDEQARQKEQERQALRDALAERQFEAQFGAEALARRERERKEDIGIRARERAEDATRQLEIARIQSSAAAARDAAERAAEKAQAEQLAEAWWNQTVVRRGEEGAASPERMAAAQRAAETFNRLRSAPGGRSKTPQELMAAAYAAETARQNTAIRRGQAGLDEFEGASGGGGSIGRQSVGAGKQQQRLPFNDRLDQLIADGESMESAKRKMQREGYNIQAMR